MEGYLALERVMLGLDDAGDSMADRVRDAMDPLWYGMTDEERAQLNSRGFIAAGAACMRIPLGEGLFSSPVGLAPADETLHTERVVVQGWALAA
jgi:hypothetical protein